MKNRGGGGGQGPASATGAAPDRRAGLENGPPSLRFPGSAGAAAF